MRSATPPRIPQAITEQIHSDYEPVGTSGLRAYSDS